MSTDIYDPYPPIQNKYYKWYMNICNKAKERGSKKKLLSYYTESHHIIPKSFYKIIKKDGWLNGNPHKKSNKILLTSKEHFLVHWLLCECYHGLAKSKMTFAFYRLCVGNNNKTSIYYQYSKKLFSLERKGHTFNRGLKRSKKFRDNCANRELGNTRGSANKGRKPSAAEIDKNCNNWLITTPTNQFITIRNLRQFCRDNNLNQASMWKVSKGLQTHHKQYKCSKID